MREFTNHDTGVFFVMIDKQGWYYTATQAGAFARTLELANNEALSRQDLDLGVERMVSNDRAYEHVFVLRLDEELVRADIDCLFGMDAPINWWSNFDEFAYFPGRYFECAVKHRHFLGVGDLEKIQRLAGDQVTYQLKQTRKGTFPRSA